MGTWYPRPWNSLGPYETNPCGLTSSRLLSNILLQLMINKCIIIKVLLIIYLVLWSYGWVFLGLETADVRRRWTWVPFITEGYSRLDHQISSCAWAVTIGLTQPSFPVIISFGDREVVMITGDQQKRNWYSSSWLVGSQYPRARNLFYKKLTHDRMNLNKDHMKEGNVKWRTWNRMLG